MFEFFKSKKIKDRELFASYMTRQISSNQAISIDTVLDKYIKEYKLLIQHHFDEPSHATSARTKLKILEESCLPESCDDLQFQEYYNGLKQLVQMFNTMSPDLLKMMKQKNS